MIGMSKESKSDMILPTSFKMSSRDGFNVDYSVLLGTDNC